MADSTTGGILTAGIQVDVGGVKNFCCATPDMGSEPERIDVTSFDDMTHKRYIAGLQDVQTLNFDFYAKGAKMPAKQGTGHGSITYPDETTYGFTGSWTAFMLAAQPNEALKFRVAFVVDEWDE